jgi:ATP-dependent protease HslVU (ClpYQ) ATPase subunit
MKNIQNLNDIFDINAQEDTPSLPMVPEAMNANKEMDQEDDYQLARQTMRKLLMKGETTLDELIELSKNSEHPRTYEVAGQFMKTMSDVSKDLLNLQKQVKELKADEPQQKIGTQNNVVFAGSTSELMKLLGKKDDNIIDQ